MEIYTLTMLWNKPKEKIRTYGPSPLPEQVLRYERLLLIWEIQKDHPTREAMAEALLISIRSLYYKLEQHGIGSMTPDAARMEYTRGML